MDNHSQSRVDAKLASVSLNGEWCWKPARSDNLVDIQRRLLEIQLGDSDKPIWTIARNGDYVSFDT
jgi:hypothetical protein